MSNQFKEITTKKAKQEFIDRGYVPLFNEYVNSKSKLLALNSEGYKIEMALKELKKGKTPNAISKFNRYSIENIQLYCKKNNIDIKLLSNKYKTSTENLKWECSCGNIFETAWNTFKNMNKHYCNECGFKKCGLGKYINIEEVKSSLRHTNTNIEILFELKKNNHYYLRLKCKIDGYEWETSKSHILNGDSGCPKCSHNAKLTLDEVKNNLYIINKNIEILSDKYINNLTQLKCKCLHDGNIFMLPWSDLKGGHGCKKCYLRNNTGINSSRYNLNLTQSEREKGRNYLGEHTINKWRKSVFERDNYTCQCCGDNKGRNLEAHHIDGWNWFKEGRFDITNGVTLCDECHKKFHSIYLNGNNTEQQYNEFKMIRLKIAQT